VAIAVDPIREERWREFIDRCPAATAFHHPAWLRLLGDQYGYDMRAVCVEGADGRIEAGLPLARIHSLLTGKRLVALPFTDACPPLVASDAPADARDALDQALRAEQERESLELEVRDWLPGLGGGAGDRFYSHTLELQPDPAAVEVGFSKSQVRRGIKKAKREGVTIERSTERSALDEFYRLHVGTRRRQGVPTQPRSFIRRFERLFADGLGFALVARWEDRPISAAVFLAHNGTLIYKYGASDRDHLDKRPNNLLFMEAIRWGCLNAMTRLDFGRTDLDNEGLRSFKRAWGAEEQVLAYTRLPVGPARSAVRSGHAPLGFVIRRSPPVVGQMVGSVLYRHVG
jgi:CelD/BcsL family acetyltransferase involved in cellulose biosynthesis